MSPQIAKVSAAGTNKLGYRSDNSPVVTPFMGRILANALMMIVPRKPSKFRIDRDNTTRLLSIAFPPVLDRDIICQSYSAVNDF
jgi:hypothetical protein